MSCNFAIPFAMLIHLAYMLNLLQRLRPIIRVSRYKPSIFNVKLIGKGIRLLFRGSGVGATPGSGNFSPCSLILYIALKGLH